MAGEKRPLLKYMSGSFLGKSVDDVGDKTLLRYIFTSDKLDEVGDIITREATEEATERWKEWRNIRFQHMAERPIGKAVRVGKADGLAWNEMDVRIDDPDILPLVSGDDPVLGGASVGIIVNEYEINDDPEAVARAWYEPWKITNYDFIEISLVDHPANYDAKRVGEVSAGRSATLFRRLDLMPEEKNNMDPKEEDVVLTKEPVDKAVETEVENVAVVEEVESAEQPDAVLAEIAEIKSLLSGLEGRLSAKMDEISGVLTKSVEPEEKVEEIVEAVEEPVTPVESDEAVVEAALEEPEVEAVQEPEEDLAGDIAQLGRRVEAIYERISGNETEEPKVVEAEEPDDLDERIKSIVAQVFEEKGKLTARKSAVVAENEEPEDKAELEKGVDPRAKLRMGVMRALQNRG